MEKLVPKIRFPEFEVNWKKKEIGQICKVDTGNKDTKNKIESGSYPFFVRSNTVERINSYSYDGEAILTSGDGVGVGKNFHYINGKFDYHQRVYCLKQFKSDISGKFLFFIFSENFYRRVIRLSAKNSVDSVRMDMITKMQLGFPSLAEQQKIATFLTSVDERITLLEKQKQGLETYKKGVMQQLFSQQLRFKDDAGRDFPDWEEKKLGDEVLITKGQQLNKETLSLEGNYPCQNGGIEPSGYTDNFNAYENTITISEGGNSCGYVNYMSTKFWCGGHCYTLTDVKLENKFLYQYLKYHQEQIMNLRVGSGLPNIQKSTLSSFKIHKPCLAEQKKIASFLSAIDARIEVVSKQIEQSKVFKKGLLQQLFV